MQKVFDDYKIIKKLNKDKNGQYYLLECNICGNLKKCNNRNLLKQDNHHSKFNCKYNYYKNEIGKSYGDYIVKNVELDSKRGYLFDIECKICGMRYKTTYCCLKNKSHNPSTCKEKYYESYKGKIFGDFKVLDYHKEDNIIKFICECNKCHRKIELKEYRLNDLLSHSRECIKLVPDSDIKKSIIRRFHDMYQRCNNKNSNNYMHYGERGIKLLYDSAVDLYDDFYDDFVNLLKDGKDIKKYSFDRIDVNGNYEKNNLRLTTQLVQSTNTTRKSIFIIEKDNERIISDNPMECGRYINCSGRALGNLIRGKSKSSAGWKLYKKYNQNNLNIEEIMIKESVTTNLIVS